MRNRGTMKYEIGPLLQNARVQFARKITATLVASAMLATCALPVAAQQSTPEAPSATAQQSAQPPTMTAQQQASPAKPLVDYSKPRRHFPNIVGPYVTRHVPEPVLANTPRIDTMLRDGKLMLSLNDAVALALENNLDIAIARYNLEIADTDLLRTAAGASVRGVATGLVQGTPGGGVGGFGTGATGAGAGGTSGGAGGAGTGASGLVQSTLGAG